MKRTIYLLLVAIAIMANYSLSAQMSVTADGSSADASAMLEVKSSDKGFLPPRVNLTSDVNSPATGLLVYQTGGTPGFYFYNGSAWTAISHGPSVPTGTSPGQMQYWNGTAWVTVSNGSEGLVLTYTNGVPTWKTQLKDYEVDNPITGETWMDRNLGAGREAFFIDDADAYGDLYQWGRYRDGHEERTSDLISTQASTAVPNQGNTWDGKYILASSDWLTPQNDNLWQGVSGTNNPCPSGYRLPTETELNAERLSWNSNDAAGAYLSPLRFPAGGSRDPSSGLLGAVGIAGVYWTSTVAGTSSIGMEAHSNIAGLGDLIRVHGCSVRCIKD